jgi:hypothetical protein
MSRIKVGQSLARDGVRRAACCSIAAIAELAWAPARPVKYRTTKSHNEAASAGQLAARVPSKDTLSTRLSITLVRLLAQLAL